MRICFISRRFFPAISGMSVYALNLIRQLTRDGHDVTMISQYRADPAAAEALLKTGERPAPADLDRAELAAWTSVARVLLNLHETIARN